MKAFASLTLLALAGAASACTFGYRTVKGNDGRHVCSFEVYEKDNANPKSAGADPNVGQFYPKDCNKRNLCHTAKSKHLGPNYDFCIDGIVRKDGTVDGDVTVQRDGGTKVSLKRDGNEDVKDSQVLYWRGDISCKGIDPISPANPSKGS